MYGKKVFFWGGGVHEFGDRFFLGRSKSYNFRIGEGVCNMLRSI